MQRNRAKHKSGHARGASKRWIANVHTDIPSEPDKAEIAVDGADDLYKEIRIENTLTDEDGNEVSLKKGCPGGSDYRGRAPRYVAQTVALERH
jgi:hypothetical protein